MFKILDDISYVPTPRISTRVAELDWIYGGEEKNWGLPKGKISLWSGPSGTGKSKSLISVSKLMSGAGHPIMYFQNEVTAKSFRGWIGPDRLPRTFYISEETTLDAQINDIIMSKARLAIVDSVNQIKEFGNGHKKAIQLIYDRYRYATKKTGVHIVFICQLDKQDQIKGGSELKFLSDTVVDLGYHIINKQIIDGYFTVNMGDKHRYGKTGQDLTSLWQHTDNGAVCISDNRLYNKDWCSSHNLCLKKRAVAPLGHTDEMVVGDNFSFYIPDAKIFKKSRKRRKVV